MKQLDLFGSQRLLDDVTNAVIAQNARKRKEHFVRQPVVALRARNKFGSQQT